MASSLTDRVQQFIEDVWNQRKVDSVAEFLKSDVVLHRVGHDVHGLKNYCDYCLTPLLDAFPTMHRECVDAMEQDDRVAIRWSGVAVPPSDALGVLEPKPISVAGMSWFRFEDQMIVEIWDGWDQTGFFQRLYGKYAGWPTSSEMFDGPPASGQQPQDPPPSPSP